MNDDNPGLAKHAASSLIGGDAFGVNASGNRPASKHPISHLPSGAYSVDPLEYGALLNTSLSDFFALIILTSHRKHVT
jgi:hypothetical protein